MHAGRSARGAWCEAPPETRCARLPPRGRRGLGAALRPREAPPETRCARLPPRGRRGLGAAVGPREAPPETRAAVIGGGVAMSTAMLTPAVAAMWLFGSFFLL